MILAILHLRDLFGMIFVHVTLLEWLANVTKSNVFGGKVRSRIACLNHLDMPDFD